MKKISLQTISASLSNNEMKLITGGRSIVCRCWCWGTPPNAFFNLIHEGESCNDIDLLLYVIDWVCPSGVGCFAA